MLLAAVSVYRRCFGQYLIYKLRGLLDTVGNFDADKLFAVKTFCFNAFVSCNNNSLGVFNFFLCEYVLCSARTVCFNFNGYAEFFAGFFKRLSRHISVGNSGRAGSNSQNSVSTGFSCRCLFSRTIRIFRFLCVVNCFYKLFSVFSRKQIVPETFIHKQYHKS